MPDIRFSVLAEVTERVDRFLADQLQLSRTQAARLVAGRAVQVNGAEVRASRVLERGEEVRVIVPDDPAPRTLVPAHIPLDIVYEDQHIVVINKPADLVVHPAPGHWDDTLVNALVARGPTLAGGAAGRPGIVHRLDRDTSGLMVVALTDQAHQVALQLGVERLQADGNQRLNQRDARVDLGYGRQCDARHRCPLSFLPNLSYGACHG